jgi:hypothetical protein
MPKAFASAAFSEEVFRLRRPNPAFGLNGKDGNQLIDAVAVPDALKSLKVK